MTRWELSEPGAIDLGDEPVRQVKVRTVAGNVDVTATTGPARLEITAIEGKPLVVTLENGVLSVAYEDLSWGGLLSWSFDRSRSVDVSIAVPPDCPVELGVVSATALVSGMTAPTAVKSVSGDVTLDGLSSRVKAQTVSGTLETQALDGALDFETVSGDLTVAGGRCDSLHAKSVSGEILLDVEAADVKVKSVSGDVLVRLPEDSGLQVAVKTVSGKLTAGFDELRPNGRRLEGRVGDGTGRLQVQTVSGDVAVLRR